MPVSRCCGPAAWASPALAQGAGLGGHPSRGTPPSPASPLSAGSAIFSPPLTLFLFSVISNNVTASLESIHQSRKKPMLTLIKKYHLCLTGKSSQPSLWRHPCPRSRPPAISRGAQGRSDSTRGGVPSHRWCPHSHARPPHSWGRWALTEASTLGVFRLQESLIWPFFPFF